MSKEKILGILESIISDPGSYKSGEYLEMHIFRSLIDIQKTEKHGIIEALQEWIETQSEPRTMLAVRLAKKLRIVELIPQIGELRHKINIGEIFPKFYLRYIDEALTELQKN